MDMKMAMKMMRNERKFIHFFKNLIIKWLRRNLKFQNIKNIDNYFTNSCIITYKKIQQNLLSSSVYFTR